jgi:urea carboxylase
VYDYAYAIGTANFTGDMPIIITVDGPSLGGFVSLATITTADLWKVGQAKPYDTVRFRKVTVEEAVPRLKGQEGWL